MSSSQASSSDEDDISPVRAAATILAKAASDGKQQDTQSNNKSSDGKTSASSLTRSSSGASKNSGPAGETVTHERRWEIMFERLKAYKAKHGNTLVPNRYPEDTQLGSWVSAQRRQYKIVTNGGSESAAMTAERAQKLRGIGFEWSTTNPRNVPWETRYAELQAFVANYGHAEVPMRWEENPQLSNWVSKQRHQYKLMQSNRPSRLNTEKVKRLNKVGFVWEASRRRLLDGTVAKSQSDENEEEEEDTDPGSSQASPVPKKPRRSKARAVRKSRIGTVVVDSRMAANLESRGGSTLAAGPVDPPGNTVYARPRSSSAAAQQGAAAYANFGLWAAMAAGQANMMQNQAMVAAAGPVNPQLFTHLATMMPFGAALPGMPFPPAHLGSSLVSTGITAIQQPSQNDTINSIRTYASVSRTGEEPEGKTVTQQDETDGADAES